MNSIILGLTMRIISPSEVPNVKRLRCSALRALRTLEKYHHLYGCTQAIQKLPHLRAGLMKILLNVEHTYRLIDGENRFPSSDWAYSTLTLLRIIRIAACGSMKVSEALHDLKEQFMEIISRFRSIHAGNSNTLKEIHQLCMYFEERLNVTGWES